MLIAIFNVWFIKYSKGIEEEVEDKLVEVDLLNRKKIEKIDLNQNLNQSLNLDLIIKKLHLSKL
jgi:hypothetical protein